MSTSCDLNLNLNAESIPCSGLIPKALPEATKMVNTSGSDTGVSTRNILKSLSKVNSRTEDISQWYVLRCAYGQEKKAYEYILNHNGTAFHPTTKQLRLINGKKKKIEVSRFPNILFAYGTLERIQSFVYDNVNLPFLRFYYECIHRRGKLIKKPLVVPKSQMDGLKIICSAEDNDIILESRDIPKFKKGQLVRVVEGKFQGVTGRVARYQGQQRVAIVVDGLLTAITAYIPRAFINPI